MRNRVLFSFVAVGSFFIGLAAFLLVNNVMSPPTTTEKTNFADLPISGFAEVTGAKESVLVSVDGFIDEKVLCRTFPVCETYLFRSDGLETEGIPIRLNICSDGIGLNCITRMSVAVDYRDVWVQDFSGKQIDFDGARVIEEPNTWTYSPKRVRLTGRVSIVNGTGRFIEPIERIEVAP